MAASAGAQALQTMRRVALAGKLAPRGAFLALSSPKVLNNYVRLTVPILLTTAITQFVAFVLVLPFRILLFLVWIVSFGSMPGLDAAHDGLDAVGLEALYLSPLLVMLLFKIFYRNSISQCFFQIFEHVNPSEAARMKDLKPIPKAPSQSSSKREKPTDLWGRVCLWAEWVWSNKPLALMLISLGVRMLSRSEHLGFLGAPVSTFVLLAGRMRRRYAGAVTLLCVIPFIRPLALLGSELFRGSLVLSKELIDPFVSRNIPHHNRNGFIKSYEPEIFAFGLPFYLLMNIKFIGPTTFILAQAASAVLCDHIARDMEVDQHEAAERSEGPGNARQQHNAVAAASPQNFTTTMNAGKTD